MTTSDRLRLTLAAVAAGLGLVAVGSTFSLTWQEPDFRLGPAIRVIMALAGGAVLIIAAWPATPRRPIPRAAIAVLGVAVLVYPTTLSWAAAGTAGPLVEGLGYGGHVLPLTLVQVLPVLASQRATGRSRRFWLVLIVAVAVASLLASVYAGGNPESTTVALLGSVLWFGSFVLAPWGTWAAVRGLGGERRRRAVVAGLAAVIPVVIIAWCLVLGIAAATQGLDGDVSITALMAGFSLATLGTAALAAAATGPETAPLLRRRVVLALLALLLAAATTLLAVGTSLVALQLAAPGAAAAVLGVVVTALLGLVAVRLYGWAARALDPAAELAERLAAAGAGADGTQRLGLERALRQVSGDAAATLLVRAADGPWVDVRGDTRPDAPATAYVLAASADGPVAVLVPTAPGTDRQLARLGDAGALVRPAVLEATVLVEQRRAAAAAAGERARLAQDLHDGLQGRLLGLALNLQLSGRELEDPSARLLVEQTVSSLRDAVDDVRDLAGGRLPAILVDAGLAPALAALVAPLGSVVELDVPGERLPAVVEETGYFVVSEALGNALKHAGAERVGVRLRRDDRQVQISVHDDGAGGADPRLGSGLRGLTERVAAAGGVLVVREAEAGGTVVEATLPCGW